MSTQTATFNPDSFTYDPSTYVNAGGGQILPSPGVYRFRVTSVARRKDREGNLVLKDGTWPTIVLNRVEIVEPADDGGSSFAIFENVRSKPYVRKNGAVSGPVSMCMDLVRSMDQQAVVEGGFEGAAEEVERMLASGQTFVGQLGYTALDLDFAIAQINEAGGKDALSAETTNKIWNGARLSTKDFKNPDGTYRTSAMGRSGIMLDAKPTITKFIPSETTVNLGPF